MSLGIAIFGMVPFGWRVMGALAGILMLPAMYLLGKQLTKKSSFAFAAALMLALDCQHFTQSALPPSTPTRCCSSSSAGCSCSASCSATLCACR